MICFLEPDTARSWAVAPQQNNLIKSFLNYLVEAKCVLFTIGLHSCYRKTVHIRVIPRILEHYYFAYVYIYILTKKCGSIK